VSGGRGERAKLADVRIVREDCASASELGVFIWRLPAAMWVGSGSAAVKINFGRWAARASECQLRAL
jgi:hypothetical protein